jgi:hypothetical protein
MHRYRIFNFDIESDIRLPCDHLTSSHPFVPHPDFSIKVRYGMGKTEFKHAHYIGRRDWGTAYNVGNGVFLSTFFGGTMHFSPEEGAIYITFDPKNDCQERMMSSWFVNFGLGVYSLLQGQIPLHGASVEVEGQTICLMAESGTGKSTLLWRLLESGALIGSDDQLPIRFEKGRVLATPALSLHGKLSGDALTRRGQTAESFLEIAPNVGEYWVPVEAEQRAFQVRTPAALVVLRPHVASQGLPDGILVRQHTGATAFSLMMANTHSLWAVGGVINATALAAQYLEVSRQVPVFTLHYKRTMGVLPYLVQCVHEIADQAAIPSRLAA